MSTETTTQREGQIDDLSEARRLLRPLADRLDDLHMIRDEDGERLLDAEDIANVRAALDFLARVGDPATPQERHKREREASRYNGWTNYETWAVALWFGNEGDDEAREEWARECYSEAEQGEYEWEDRTTVAIGALADRLQENFEEDRSNGGWWPDGLESGPCVDILRANLASVEWREIARHYVEEIAVEVAWDEALEEYDERAADAEDEDSDEG